jgi:hypothetical protein
MMVTLSEAVFKIEQVRHAEGPPRPITDLHVNLVDETGRDAIVYFELEGHEWAAAGFELPTLVVEAEFDAGYYEAEALRLLRQRRQ